MKYKFKKFGKKSMTLTGIESKNIAIGEIIDIYLTKTKLVATIKIDTKKIKKIIKALKDLK